VVRLNLLSVAVVRLNLLSVKRLPDSVSARRGFERIWLRVTDAIIEIGTPQEDLPLLTDDFAPVERLIADLLIGENK